MTSNPAWHDIFRYIKLKANGPDKVLTAETYKDTLNIIAGPGVSWGGPSTFSGDFSDTFEINVDYDINVPISTTKVSLEDINGNLSEVNFKAGRGMVITRSNGQELQFESFSITETDTLHTITSRNNITSNKIFVNNLEVGTISSSFTEDGFTGYDSGHDLIGNGTLSDPLRFSPIYQKSIDANKTDDFTFTASGPGTFSYQSNYTFDTTISSASILLQREDPSNPGNWTTLDTVTGIVSGIAYSISGIYSELYVGSVNYRLIFNWTNNTGTVTWYVYNTFEGGGYTPINNPQLKTDTTAKTVTINDIQFFQNNISTTSSNTDIVLTPHGVGKVIVSNDLRALSINNTAIGNINPASGSFTSLTANGSVTFTQNIASTNTTTGTLVVTGGVGVSGKINSTDLEVTNIITGSISGNAATVTNGVYTTVSYANPSWITSLDAAKIVGSIQLSDVTIDGDLRLFDNVISTTQTNSDIVLDPVGTGKVRSLSNIVAPTFEGNVTGDVSGNAGTVTNGVYTSGTYADPSWITSLDGSKLTGTVVATNGVVTTGTFSDPSWITSLDGSKLTGTVVATNGVVTTGTFSDPSWITSLDGSKLTGTVVATNGVVTIGTYSDPSWITSLNASKIFGSIQLSDVTVDSTIKIRNNVIETIVSNANLELRANGAGVVNVTDGFTVTGTSTFDGTTKVQQIKEKVISGTAPAATETISLLSGAVYRYANNNANDWVINFRGNGSTFMNTFLSIDESTTVTLITRNSGTAWKNTSVQVDGTAVGVTVVWQGGTAYPAGNTNSTDIYTYTIIKTAASTYTVIASQTKYG